MVVFIVMINYDTKKGVHLNVIKIILRPMKLYVCDIIKDCHMKIQIGIIFNYYS